VTALAFLDDWDPALIAAFVAAAVSILTLVLGAPLRMWVERYLQTYKLKSEYEYEQRKELRSLIGRYHGRLLEASENLHHRLDNLYRYEDERWLDSPDGYYFQTTEYRFLAVCSLARAFEREALFIDSRIAEPNDFEFLRFIKAFLWVTTSAVLFKDLPYDESRSTDHFFADQIREISDTFCSSPDELPTYAEFKSRLAEERSFDDVQEFFLGLHSSEERLRWDRLVALDLFLLAFLGTVGYETQRPEDDELVAVAEKIRHPEIRRNLILRLPKLGLAQQPQMKRVQAALVSAGLPSA
jgi:hypothetical protein